MRSLDYTLQEAETFLNESSPGAADVVLWTILGKNPRDERAWELLSKVAASVGASGFASRFSGVTASLRGQAAPAPVQDSLSVRGEERFLIIKAWGYGFCSDLDHTVAGLLLAEITGRTPVTHWGSNSLFSVDPKRDAFREYFDPVSPWTIEDVARQAEESGDSGAFWPPKWNADNLRVEKFQKQMGPYSRLAGIQFLNRPEKVAVADYHLSVITLIPWIPPAHPMHGRDTEAVLRYLFPKYIRPVPDLREQIESFAAERFNARPIIGVHIRGSDKYKEEPQLQQRQAMYPQAIDHLAQGSQCPIFLISDSQPIVEEYQRRYGARLIVPPAVRSTSIIGVHHLGHTDRRAIGAEVVRDIYLAAKCDKFVGLGSSNVSATIHHLREWPPGSTVYLSNLITHRADPYQYLSFDQLARYFGSEWSERMKQVLV